MQPRRTITLQLDTTSSTAFEGDKPLFTIQRKHRLAPGPEWTVYDTSGALIRHFIRTQWLVNWLVNCRATTIEFRPDLDQPIAEMIHDAHNF